MSMPRQSAPQRGQRLKQLARAQGRAGGGINAAVDRGEKKTHRMPGKRAKTSRFDRMGSARTNPLRLCPCSQEETTFRQGRQVAVGFVVFYKCGGERRAVIGL